MLCLMNVSKHIFFNTSFFCRQLGILGADKCRQDNGCGAVDVKTSVRDKEESALHSAFHQRGA